MKINLDYRRSAEDAERTSNQELTRDYLEYAIMKKFPEMQGQKLRIYGRIQRKLDDAVENKTDDIEFEEAEKDMIRDAFKEPNFPAKLSKFVTILWDEVDTALAPAQAAPKAQGPKTK